MRSVIRLVLLLLVAALALPEAAWATRLGSGPGGSGNHRHFHHRVFVGSAFYFGAPWYPWYAYPYPPYYYGPSYEATTTPPSLYVEKFEGTPNANSGEIYCPSAGEYYPDVQSCANGWQRIIRPGGG